MTFRSKHTSKPADYIQKTSVSSYSRPRSFKTVSTIYVKPRRSVIRKHVSSTRRRPRPRPNALLWCRFKRWSIWMFRLVSRRRLASTWSCSAFSQEHGIGWLRHRSMQSFYALKWPHLLMDWSWFRMELFTCLAWAWVDAAGNVWESQQIWPRIPTYSHAARHSFSLRNPGDRMESVPINCLISRFLPGVKLRNCMHTCVCFYGSTTGYGINDEGEEGWEHAK